MSKHGCHGNIDFDVHINVPKLILAKVVKLFLTRGLSKVPPPPLVLYWVKLFETIVNGLDYFAPDLCGAFFRLRTIMRQYARFSGSQFNRGCAM